MYTYIGVIELQMTKEQAHECSHQGDCYNDVSQLVKEKNILRQFKKISPDQIRKELGEYGAWDDQELADDYENQLRLLWLAACNIREEQHAQD